MSTNLPSVLGNTHIDNPYLPIPRVDNPLSNLADSDPAAASRLFHRLIDLEEKKTEVDLKKTMMNHAQQQTAYVAGTAAAWLQNRSASETEISIDLEHGSEVGKSGLFFGSSTDFGTKTKMRVKIR